MKKLREFILVFILGLVAPLSLLFLADDGAGHSQNILTTVETTGVPESLVEVQVLTEDQAVVTMPLDEYVFRVVLREMPADFEPEALKAQAVVVRTYTLRHMIKPKHDAASVCTDSSCCQGYREATEYLCAGGSEKNLVKVKKAVEDTSGEILTYAGKPIDATYFSCSGGMTEDAAAVWGEDVPYLKATTSPGEEKAKHYIETVRMSTLEFADKLGITIKGPTHFAVGKIRYTAGGGVASMEICGQRFTGTQLRNKLGLRSTAFVIAVVGNNVTITTKGFGHRVGMSQYGADAMAIAGADYTEILMHYYTGVDLTTIDAVY